MGPPKDRYSKTMTRKPCPICKKAAQDGFAPFCSARCADIDLGRWFSGRYAIPARPEEDETGDEPAASLPGQAGRRLL